MANDFELLREHIEQGSEEAFQTLVERHARMVYGTAFRVLADAQNAEEATQAVFVLLARKASSIRRETILAGWLYRTARFVALESLRAERRRRQRHEMLAEMNDTTDPVWPKISPLLEDVMARLGESDRDAVVLRFLEEKSFEEVGRTMGTTEAAAKMRVGRALEKLRRLLAREGVAITTTVLATALVAGATSTAPQHLFKTISSVALAQSPAAEGSLATLIKGALKVMAWNKIRNTGIAVVLILLLGGGAVFTALHLRKANSPALIVSTFEPMAGEWEGTFEMNGDGFPKPMSQVVTMTARTPQNGRVCQIEMRVSDSDGGGARLFRFSHSLNQRGDRIITLDDPHIARPLGEGVVTASEYGAGEVWRAAFRAMLADGSGATECEWSRRGDELNIVRYDRTVTPQGESTMVSSLRLRRVASAKL